MTAIAPTTLPIELRCPKCGNDGNAGAIRYLVDVVSRADVVRLGRDAVLELAGPLRESVCDPHTRPRFECAAPRPTGRACGHRWPVPDGISRVTWARRS